MSLLPLNDFPLRTYDKIRYADTDRQGHVNNAVFATFLETGRVECLYSPDLPLLAAGASFVIVSLNLTLSAELRWPGTVEIGTGVLKTGTSSIRLYQQLFQHGKPAAHAETVIVQVGPGGQSAPLTESARNLLSQWLLPARS